MSKFLTIEAPAEGIYKEKGSKFLAYAYPISNEDEIKIYLEALKAEHFKARHHCYAYRLGAGGSIYRASDAAEPPNSAGPPILNQIRSHELTNVLVVVVRYFGGTKLGVSGLIQAYKSAAADALAHARIKEDYEKVRMDVETSYESLSELMNFIKNKSVNLVSQNFGQEIVLSLEVPEEDVALVKEGIGKIRKTKII